MNNRSLGVLAIIITAVLWGWSFLSIKILVPVVPPMSLAAIRFLIASILLFGLLKYKEPETKLERIDMPLMASGGIIGVSVYFYFANNGVKLTTASTSSMVIAAVPIFTILADVIIFGNKMSYKKLVSVLLSIVGVYFVLDANYSELVASGQGKGYLMMVGAAFSWVCYTFITRPLFKKYSQLAIVCYQGIFGTMALIPFTVFDQIKWQSIDTTIVLNILYLAIFSSAIGYYLYVYSIDVLGADVSTLFINLIPVVAVISSHFLLGEITSTNQKIGGILVVLAVYLASFKGREIMEVVPEQVKL